MTRETGAAPYGLVESAAGTHHRGDNRLFLYYLMKIIYRKVEI
jgi:hypothetical protein